MRYILIIAIIFSSGCGSKMKSKLLWEDNFDYSVENIRENWNIIEGNGCPELCGFGNNELQYYTENNISIKDDQLIITAIKTNDDKNFTSAKLTSKQKGDWKGGYIEVRAKLPEGRGTWPAIWMLPSQKKPLDWPLDGEIDIMEHVGYNQGQIYGTIHTEAYNHVKGTQKSDSIMVNDASEAFHNYALEWTDDQLVWYVDGTSYHKVNKNGEGKEGWPFIQPFHLILNLAVGGDWGGRYGVAEDIWPQQLIIDYVKVYSEKPE
jgi:beta-glucanase (GH16 family)